MTEGDVATLSVGDLAPPPTDSGHLLIKTKASFSNTPEHLFYKVIIICTIRISNTRRNPTVLFFVETQRFQNKNESLLFLHSRKCKQDMAP